MRKNADRYRLCLQCIEEVKVSNTNDVGIGERARVLKDIEDDIRHRRKWHNPVWWVYWKYHNLKYDDDKLCPGCCYALEHTVLAGEEVHENRKV